MNPDHVAFFLSLLSFSFVLVVVLLIRVVLNLTQAVSALSDIAESYMDSTDIEELARLLQENPDRPVDIRITYGEYSSVI